MNKYLIYDGEDNGLWTDDIIIEAKTGKEAILKHLKKTGRKYKIRRSKDNNVLFKAVKIEVKEKDRYYKIGNDIWYKIDY